MDVNLLTENHPVFPDEQVIVSTREYREYQDLRKLFSRYRMVLLFASGVAIGYGVGKLR